METRKISSGKFINFIEKYKFLSIIVFVILFLVPNFITRLIAVLGILVYIVNNNEKLDRKLVFTILFSLFLLAYVFSPYWNIFKTILLKILSLVLLLIIAAFWAKNSSDTIIIDFKFRDKLYLITLTTLLFIVNYRNLAANISWRGDEDYHIGVVLNFLVKPGISVLQSIINNIILIIIIIFIITGAVIYYQYTKKNKAKKLNNVVLTIYGFMALAMGYLISLVFTNLGALNSSMDVIIRYPFLMKWITSLFVFPVRYDVSLYRFIPFLSIVLISWFLYYKVNEFISDKKISMLLSFAFTTIPILFFFSSILYLEMPVVLFMTVVVFNIDFFVKSKISELFRSPIFYCLLLVSFMKETVIIIIVLSITVRFLYQLSNKKLIKKINNTNFDFLIKKRNILQEIKLYVILSAPIILYLFFRIFGHGPRAYGMQIQNLINPFSYFVFGKALFDQVGLVIILALAGLVFCFFSKDRMKCLVPTILFIGISMFFIADKFIYIGYSRWNLFLVPIILFFSVMAVKNLKNKYPRIIPLALILIIIISNVILMPTNIYGVKKSNWGSPLTNTAEHTYPYIETFKWLKNEGKTEHLLVTGYNYRGYSQFYLEKYGFDLNKLKVDEFIPKQLKYVFFNETIENELLYGILQDLDNSYNTTSKSELIFFDQTNIQNFSTVDTIVYFSMNNIELEESTILLGKFKIEKKITNGEKSVYIIKVIR